MTIRKKPYYTPLRYPGGKGKLANYIKHIAADNELVGGHYVEVYAGGAGIAMELLIEGYFNTIAINDIDPAVHAFWWSILNDCENLKRKIIDIPINMEEWRIQRHIYTNPEQYSTLELGFATFFLNRCNRSGILKGGVIGGQNQSGKWKLDARFNKENLISRINKIAAKADNIKLSNQDALQFIQDEIANRGQQTLLYLDPPYYKKGKGLYRNFYKHNDHKSVSDLMRSINDIKWLMSYDNVSAIVELYEGYRTLSYTLSYTAQNKFLGSELLIFSENLKVPDTDRPTKIRAA